MSRVATQIKQLGVSFNHELIGKLKDVVNTEVVEGVHVDESELASMEEMMREASKETNANQPPGQNQVFPPMSARSTVSNASET